MLSVAMDPFKTNTSFIIHLPTLSDSDMSLILQKDISHVDISLSQVVVKYVLRMFATQTNSLSELRTIRDMVLAYCNNHNLSSVDDQKIQDYVISLQSSLFVNILPIYSESMSSIQNSNEAIPLSDFCGVEISLNAKLLLITGYLCSIYPESHDIYLFGKDDEQHVKSKGRRRRKNALTITPSLVSIK